MSKNRAAALPQPPSVNCTSSQCRSSRSVKGGEIERIPFRWRTSTCSSGPGSGSSSSSDIDSSQSLSLGERAEEARRIFLLDARSSPLEQARWDVRGWRNCFWEFYLNGAAVGVANATWNFFHLLSDNLKIN
jgi:hypothetical protein